MFPLERQHDEERQRRHPDRQGREREQEKAADFTVFEEANSAVVLGEQIEQKKRNTAS